MVLQNAWEVASSDQDNQEGSTTLLWYNVQYPDYTAGESERDMSEDTSDDTSEVYSEQDGYQQVFLQIPLPAPLQALSSTAPAVPLLPSHIRHLEPSVVRKLLQSYPLTFDPNAVWHAWMLSPGKTAISGLHSPKSDSFCFRDFHRCGMNVNTLLFSVLLIT